MMYHAKRVRYSQQTLTWMIFIIVDNILIPAVAARHICSKDERFLLSLPVKKVGLSLAAKFEFTNSHNATEQFAIKINNQDSTSPVDGEQCRSSRRNIIKARA